MNPRTTLLMRLLEFTDSAFPVGSFSFSNGLETAAGEGLVCDAATLEEYSRSTAMQSAFTDGVAALCARRAASEGCYDSIAEADGRVWSIKLNDEARRMTCRTGIKTAEIADCILSGRGNALWNDTGRRWLGDIAEKRLHGVAPVSQGILFAACGLSGEELFCSVRYAAINTVLNAALRCVRVSHYDTQRILCTLGGETDALFREASEMTLDDMHAFVPQSDILASLHEKGVRRMFMN